MELIYFWVEKYKNIENQGFNFSSRLQCSYDKDTNKLTVIENKNYVNIFPNNINITAIVGKNGSGKSSVFEFFSTMLQNGINKKHFFILYDDTKNVYYLRNTNITCDVDKSILNFQFSNIDLYLQKYFDVYYLNISHLERDMIIQNDVPSPDDSINYLGIYEKNDFSKDNKNDITPSYSEFNYDKFNFFLVAKIAGLLTDIKYKKLLFNTFNIKKPYSIKVEYDVKKLKENKMVDSTIKAKLKGIESFLSKKNNIVTIESDDFQEFFDLADNIYNSLGLFRLSFLTKDNKIIKFSAGEKTILFYLHKIDFLIKQMKQNKRDSILLFDEIELYLHPHWQRKILNIILKFIKENNLSHKLHIIATTHSPFLLSDMPKENIIFLDNGKNVSNKVSMDTFGANIHTLLTHSFFMEDGLMGEFAKKQIDEVIKLLNKPERMDENEIKKCEEIISIIGEPIIKRQLQKMLDSRRLQEIDDIYKIKNDIKNLQKKLDELEND